MPQWVGEVAWKTENYEGVLQRGAGLGRGRKAGVHGPLSRVPVPQVGNPWFKASCSGDGGTLKMELVAI